MKKFLLSLVLSVSFVPQISQAQSEVVVEGDSISGGLSLGMTRAELADLIQNDFCNNRLRCRFTLTTTPSQPLVQVRFENNVISEITVFSPDMPQSGGFTSTAGVDFLTFPGEAADIYNVSARRFGRRNTLRNEFIVDVPQLGYQYIANLICFRTTCEVRNSRHIIFPAQ